MMEMGRFLDMGQVAELLGLSVAAIRKWVLLRYIPFKKMGRAVRFSAREVREWADSGTINPIGGHDTNGNKGDAE
jgi:excisionase family DNA binding protein